MSSLNVYFEPIFHVVGIATRTSNKEAFEAGTIGALWQQFVKENVFNKIPHKIDNTILALYYDYENGKDGYYTILIGVRVHSIKDVPKGLIIKEVPAERRKVFTTAQGSQIAVVVGTWQDIWNLESHKKLSRSYVCDYELYDDRSKDSNNAIVEIHIGIKE